MFALGLPGASIGPKSFAEVPIETTSWRVALLIMSFVVLSVLRRLGVRKDATFAREVNGEELSSPEYKSLNEDRKSYQENLPSQPHLQCCYLPPTGELLTFPNEHQRSYSYENDVCIGKTFLFHRPTFDPALDRSGDYPFADVFKGNKNNWEIRFQLRFKHAVDGKVNFGIELDEYVPLTAPTKTAMRAVVTALKWIVGDDLHHSPGDDPKVTAGEAERPIFSMPLFAFDQFVETPEGQEAPDLTNPNCMEMGIRRSDDARAFAQVINNIKFRPGPTYSFSFSSISQILDCLLWRISGVIPGVSIDFDAFCGRPPVHIVIYTLRQPATGNERDKRHLDSRKEYLYHLALWSSMRKPPRNRLQQLLPHCAATVAPVALAAAHTFQAQASPGVQCAAWCKAFCQTLHRRNSMFGCFEGLRQCMPRKQDRAPRFSEF